MNQIIITPDTLEDIKALVEYSDRDEYVHFLEYAAEIDPSILEGTSENTDWIEFAKYHGINHIYITILKIEQALGL